MKIKLIVVGKTEEAYLQEGIANYQNRIKHYINFEILTIPALKNIKNLTIDHQKQKEGELILNNLSVADVVVLLDEKGKNYGSREFSHFMQQHMNSGIKQLVFIIGGPYGFSDKVYQRAHSKLSLSKMTFSHQMIRLFFVEQLYRAMTILKGEAYHHED